MPSILDDLSIAGVAINTPMDLAIQNQIGRFTIAMDLIDRVPPLRVAGAATNERLRDAQIARVNHAYRRDDDGKPEVANWPWPF